MAKRKKRHPIRSSQVAHEEGPPIYVYFLINDSPRFIFSREYSAVYDLLQALFGDDPIPEEDAIEAINTLGSNPKDVLAVMTKYRYLHKANLEEVLK